jgi:hypothetical protein
MLGLISLPTVVGVGSDNPHPVSLVRATEVMSSEHTPCRIVPQAGKPFEDLE